MAARPVAPSSEVCSGSETVAPGGDPRPRVSRAHQKCRRTPRNASALCAAVTDRIAEALSEAPKRQYAVRVRFAVTPLEAPTSRDRSSKRERGKLGSQPRQQAGGRAGHRLEVLGSRGVFQSRGATFEIRRVGRHYNNKLWTYSEKILDLLTYHRKKSIMYCYNHHHLCGLESRWTERGERGSEVREE